jgi:hypothetical protein
VRKRKNVVIPLAVLAFAAAVTAAWFAGSRRAQPTFAGEPLSTWISRYLGQDNPREKERAAAAIRAMGDTAGAQLVDWMHYESTPTKEKLEQFLNRGPVSLRQWIPFSPSKADMRADQAAAVFPLLGPAATNAIPQLLTLLTDSHAIQSARRAMRVLSGMNEPALAPLLSLLADSRVPNRDLAVFAIAGMQLDQRAAAQALPLLLKSATDPDTPVAEVALFALGELDVDPDAAVPVLLSKAADPSPELRSRATSSLAKYAATPQHDAIARALPILLSDPDQDTREAATNLLAEITSGVLTNTAAR